MSAMALFLISFIAAFQGGERSTISWTNPSGGTGSAPTAIEEGTAAGSTGYTATATTDGAPAGLTLTIDAGSGMFTIASGLVSTSAVTDYETSATHVVYIKAVDNNSPTAATSTATVTFSITNLATDPTFPALSYCVTAADKFAAASTLGTYAASDPGGASLTYTVATGNTNTDFAISSTGVITVANILDRTTTPFYMLVIKAANAVPITATTTVVVCVGTSSQCAVCAASSSGGVAITSSIMTMLALLLVLLR